MARRLSVIYAGAERLLRNGDMLLMLEGKLTRLQGYYIDPLQIEKHLPKK